MRFRAFCLRGMRWGDALGGTFWQKGSPYTPLQKLLGKGICADGMCVQILIYRALCLRELVGRDVLDAPQSAINVPFVQILICRGVGFVDLCAIPFLVVDTTHPPLTRSPFPRKGRLADSKHLAIDG